MLSRVRDGSKPTFAVSGLASQHDLERVCSGSRVSSDFGRPAHNVEAMLLLDKAVAALAANT